MSGVVPSFYMLSWFENAQHTPLPPPKKNKRSFYLSTLLRITDSFIQGSGPKVIYSTDL